MNVAAFALGPLCSFSFHSRVAIRAHVVVVVGAGDEDGDQKGMPMERTQAIHAKEVLKGQ